MAPSPNIAVVIPALNEARTIVDLVQRARRFSEHVIVVDDGSTDGTAELLDGQGATVLRHGANEGKGASLVSGFGEALKRGVRAIVTLDGDGQHRPEDIPKLLAKAEAAPDRVVIGSRLADKAAFPPARYTGITIADFWISWASGYAIEDSQSGFRLYPRRVLERVRARSDRRHGFVFESELLINAAHAGYRSVGVAIPALYDGTLERPSHFRPIPDVSRIVLMVALKLLSRGMFPGGLYRVLRERRGPKSWRAARLPVTDCGNPPGPQGPQGH